MGALVERAGIIGRGIALARSVRPAWRRPTAALRVLSWAAASLLTGASAEAQDRDSRMAEIDRRLVEAQSQAQALQQTIAELVTELRALKEPLPAQAAPVGPSAEPPSSAPADAGASAYRDQIVRPDLGGDERGHELAAAPELFIQSRFQSLPIDDATVEDAPTNVELTRMEARWSGRVAPKVGMGFEIQYHPAPDGAAFEIVNDAFVEYYASNRVTLRVGQFVKPFGFDIQQSSAERESPERGIFAGYFFPGQRDRGVMLTAGVGDGVQLQFGAFNGNRFFTDRDRHLNVNARARKVFSQVPLAAGVSMQIGRQLLPEGVTGNDHEHAVGADLQWVWRRLGVRGEFMVGNQPSTLLDLEPDFAPAFQPGARSSGGTVFSSLRLTDADQVYGRYDQFNNDPAFGYDVQAVNVGYLRRVGSYSRLGIDYQFKNRITANDDSLNSRLQVTFNVEK
jgi:hypothetical protein